MAREVSTDGYVSHERRGGSRQRRYFEFGHYPKAVPFGHRSVV